MSAVGANFRAHLSDLDAPNVVELHTALFERPENYHQRIDDADLLINADSILVIRSCRTQGYPGSVEIINMQPPDHLIKAGISDLPTIGNRRQSGTLDAPSILNASSKVVADGGLTKLRTGDCVRIDLNNRTVNALVPEQGWSACLNMVKVPESLTSWQELYRKIVEQPDKRRYDETDAELHTSFAAHPAKFALIRYFTNKLRA
ncbi:MAG: dihydroxy-acid dehydratase [Alphaproteobacteria bacterium]|nr:dihydroxy-acid dehydratase [Alphaproteobacteria bacterium]